MAELSNQKNMKRSRSNSKESSQGNKYKICKIRPKQENDDDDDDDDKPVLLTLAKRQSVFEDKRSRHCPYLDTINRAVLDFDFEKLCSVSLSHLNVYACLVCGKYFQGRGIKSHAYTHSVLEAHHVFLNLETKKFYCLPDNYQIIDQSLEDIAYVLNPTFDNNLIKEMETSTKLYRAFDSITYLPGIVGLNNIKANDYCNVILQALSNVTPLRNYFLRVENYEQIKRPPGDQMYMLTQRFGELLRKLWNPQNFKAHVSPHEMLQAVVLCSKKKFQITKQGDCVEFLGWFLNSLHVALNGTKGANSSIVNQVFRGMMRMTSRKIPPVDLKEEDKKKLLQTEEYQEHVKEMPFLYLSCDLPPPPLYPDELLENIIPQVPIFQVLNKFNGISEKEYKDNTMKRFELLKLPRYIIVYFKRFTKNRFNAEKNPTIVNFPVKGIDFGELLSNEVRKKHKSTVYDLIANVVHEDEPGSDKGSYRVFILHQGQGKWFELQDLYVVDVLPQMITLTESYVQIYQRRDEQISKSTHMPMDNLQNQDTDN